MQQVQLCTPSPGTIFRERPFNHHPRTANYARSSYLRNRLGRGVEIFLSSVHFFLSFLFRRANDCAPVINSPPRIFLYVLLGNNLHCKGLAMSLLMPVHVVPLIISLQGHVDDGGCCHVRGPHSNLEISAHLFFLILLTHSKWLRGE